MLRQDTSALLEDAEPIQWLHRQIRTQLTEDLVATLTPAVFIESCYFQVQEAKKHIADRQSYQQATNQFETNRLRAKELKQQADELVASSLAAE